ncbi:hypothetical protein [Alicyclobacillus sp. ALC3]|uniref:hypothetical protein n=1 Tax=Alicyclobacillus sp. ALC3 TaxID=2796143 RepID=UPI002379B274|nr:hypothetical protein [Alicyclobacillus sp. ALC3]WDL96410.1 hypothetical protein JC200_19105 [Alicyclobacillus sp. ALC3]
MDVWDLRVNVTGDGEEFRADIEEDKVKLDELLALLHDRAISIKVEDADAEMKLEDIELRLADIQDATADIRLRDAEAQATLDAFRARLAEVRRFVADIYLDDANAQLQVDELAAKLEALRRRDVNVELNTVEADAQAAAFEAKMQEFRDANAKIDLEDAKAKAELDDLIVKRDELVTPPATIDVHMDQATFEETKIEMDDLAVRKATLEGEVVIRPVVDKADLAASEAELATLAVEEEAATGAVGKSGTSALGFLSSLFGGGKSKAGGSKNLLAALAQDLTNPGNAKAAQDMMGGITGLIARLASEASVLDSSNKLTNGLSKDALFTFRERLRQLGEQFAAIDMASPGAVAAVKRVQAEAHALRVDLARIPVKLETAESQATLKGMSDEAAKLESLLGGGTGGANAGGGAAAAGGAAVSPLLLALAPLLGMAAPGVLTAGIGGLGGLLGGLTAAGVGGAGLAAVSIGNIRSLISAYSAHQSALASAQTATSATTRAADLKTAAQAFAGLDTQQLKAEQSLAQFVGEWHSFERSFQTPVIKLFVGGLKLIETLMTDMRPVIQAAAQAFQTLLTDAAHALNSPFFKSFFHFLASEAGPSIVAFGQIAGNVFKAFAGFLMDMQPMISVMLGGLVRMTASWASFFATWKGSVGFETFMGYVKSNGSAIMHLLGGLVSLVWSLLQAVDPISPVLIKTVADIINWVASMVKLNPVIIDTGTVFVVLINRILKGLDVVFQFLMWLQKAHPIINDFATAIGLAIGAFFALRAAGTALLASPLGMWITGISIALIGLHEVVAHWGQIMEFVRTHAVMSLAAGMALLDVALFGLRVAFNALVMSKFGTAIGVYALNVSDAIKVTVAWTATQWKSISAGVVAGATWVGNTAKIVAQTVATYAASAATKAWELAQIALTAVMDANPISLIIIAIAALVAGIVVLVTHWKQVVAWLKEAWNWFNHLPGPIKALIAMLVPLWVVAGEIISHWRQLETFFTGMWARITQGFRAFVGIFRMSWSQLGADIINEIAMLGHQALTWGENLVNMLAKGIENGAHAVVKAAVGVAKQIKAFLGFGSPTELGPGATSDQWAPNFIKMYAAGFEAGIPVIRAAMSHVLVPPNVEAMMLGRSVGTQAAQTIQQYDQRSFTGGDVHIHNPVVQSRQDIVRLGQQMQRVNNQQMRSVGVKAP